MNILGVAAYYHDSSAALVRNGLPVAAAQEERFSRKKHDARFPAKAIEYVLRSERLNPSHVDCVVFYDKPLLKLQRIAATHLAFAPQGFSTFLGASRAWAGGKAFQKRTITRELQSLGFDIQRSPLLFSNHHASHAASAFYPSPFDSAAVLTMDGVGEWATTTLGYGSNNRLQLFEELTFPHSLGLLYSAFTDFTGFKVNSGEYKVMGLAPYGEPQYAALILDKLVDVKEDGSFRLNMEYFDFCTGNRMTTRAFADLFGGPARPSSAPLTQREMDLAASIQLVTEEIVLRTARYLRRRTNCAQLCLAGGVALNCVANGRLASERIFDRLWIQPAAGDAGGALGAALGAYHNFFDKPRAPATGHDRMLGAYLGPNFSDDESRARLESIGATYQQLDSGAVIDETVRSLAQGKAVGWFQGRMEFGPRSLGNRSILADPRSPHMQTALNLKVKQRESFRPFAPSVLLEEVEDWFEFSGESPYMLMVCPVHRSKCQPMTASERSRFGIDKLKVQRSSIPAVTHVDYSARLQTVSSRTNPLYHRLLTRFRQETGCPVLVNTSFNVRGEPIVCTPEDAFRCFMGTNIDMLVVGNCVLFKEAQPIAAGRQYHQEFEPD